MINQIKVTKEQLSDIQQKYDVKYNDFLSMINISVDDDKRLIIAEINFYLPIFNCTYQGTPDIDKMKNLKDDMEQLLEEFLQVNNENE